MHVTQIDIPKKSLINNHLPAIHYSDCFTGEFRANQDIQVETVARYFLNYNPTWLTWLMTLRNWLVKPFGLQTGDDSSPVLAITKGEKASFFDVLEVSDEEILLYANDKHLSACFLVILSGLHHQYEITFSTTVHYHNNLGRIYFFFVKPFHILIIKAMLIRIIKKFSQTNKKLYHEKKCYNASCCREY